MSKLQTNAIRHLGSAVDNLTLDNAGRVLKPNNPAFRAGHLTTTTPNGIAVFPTVFLNIGGCYNASNGRFTAPVAGSYQIDVGLLRETDAGAGNALLYLNGSLIAQSEMYSNNGFTGYKRMTGAFVLGLNANDYVQVYTNQTIHLGGNHNTFSGFLIG